MAFAPNKQITFFQPTDKSHFFNMLKAELLLHSYNKTGIWNVSKRHRILTRLFGSIQEPIYEVTSPFHCQYGKNIHIGKNFFSNFNCIILDHADVSIGDNVLFAPNVTVVTISHPKLASQRIVRAVEHSFHPQNIGDIELNAPVKIGNNVWVGANVVICAGVTIGDNSVIGAGSIVTRDIPENTFAYGIPCKAVREISEGDRIPEVDNELSKYMPNSH